MMVCVHALTGAVLARFCKNRKRAFLLGFASHLVEDMLPHRDLDPPVEAALAAGALALIGGTQGVNSREFSGAVGAVTPDIENAVARLLKISDEKLLLPSHNQYHGPKIASLHSQSLLAVACLAVLLSESR